MAYIRCVRITGSLSENCTVRVSVNHTADSEVNWDYAVADPIKEEVATMGKREKPSSGKNGDSHSCQEG